MSFSRYGTRQRYLFNSSVQVFRTENYLYSEFWYHYHNSVYLGSAIQRHVIICTERAQQAGCTILEGAEEDDPGEFQSNGSWCKVAFLELRKTHT